MGPSEKNQHAIRRSTRLPLEIPVRITSLGPGTPLSASCNTTLVNAHGCGLIAPSEFPHGIQVRLEMVSAKRYTTARVAEVVPLGGEPPTWLIGLELNAPGNFWGIEYAPTDWKIEESALPPPTQSATPESGNEAKAARSPRWRLTDISPGACYLEAAAPFPVTTPVLLSIRASDAECLLDGIVRVSHPQTGMGIEFTGPPDELRTKVEGLIARLTSNREVPKIFVGRKEGSKAGSHTAAISAVEASPDSDSSDALLSLVREGQSLTAEQFSDDLKAQRLGKRRDPRIDLALPVLLHGTDANGRPLDQRVIAVNISRRGALLEGVHGLLRPNDVISLARQQKKEEFRVAWVGDDDSPAAGQIGVAAMNPNTAFWNEVLEATAQSGLEMASLRGSDIGHTQE